jgi:LysM repeat protein
LRQKVEEEMSFLDKVLEYFDLSKEVPSETAEAEEGREVVVKKGDTLWGIAKEITGEGSRWKEIADLNMGFDENHTLHIGDELKIPQSWTIPPEGHNDGA